MIGRPVGRHLRYHSVDPYFVAADRLEFRSQFGEDALLWDFFAGQLDGFFIEVGAFDGYNYSVSYAFECIGWDGLLIEAHPDLAGKLARAKTLTAESAHEQASAGLDRLTLDELSQFGRGLELLPRHW